jgi:hypothetical protein
MRGRKRGKKRVELFVIYFIFHESFAKSLKVPLFSTNLDFESSMD